MNVMCCCSMYSWHVKWARCMMRMVVFESNGVLMMTLTTNCNESQTCSVKKVYEERLSDINSFQTLQAEVGMPEANELN